MNTDLMHCGSSNMLSVTVLTHAWICLKLPICIISLDLQQLTRGGTASQVDAMRSLGGPAGTGWQTLSPHCASSSLVFIWSAISYLQY